MADTILVVADLAADLIDAGRKLLRKLDAEGVRFNVAFWLMNPESGNWRLHLAAASVREAGRSVYYDKVYEVLTELGLSARLWIGEVTIEDTSSKLIQALISAFGEATRIDGTRLNNEPVNGIRVPPCVLYRVTADQPVGASRRPPAAPGRRSSKATRPAAA